MMDESENCYPGPIQATDHQQSQLNPAAFPQHFTAATSSRKGPGCLLPAETHPSYSDNQQSPSSSGVTAPGDDRAHNTGGGQELPETDLQQEDATDMYANNPYFKYRNLVGSISEKLRKENALRLAYVYDLPNWYHEVGPTHDPSSALRILTALESKGVFAPNKLSGLTKALETVEREDLAQMVRDFRSKVAIETMAASYTIPQVCQSINNVVDSCFHEHPPKPCHSVSTTSLLPVEDTNVFTSGTVYRSQSKPDLWSRQIRVDGEVQSSVISGASHISATLGQRRSISIGLQFALMNLKSLEVQIGHLRECLTSAIYPPNQNASLKSPSTSSQICLQGLLNNAGYNVKESIRNLEVAHSQVGTSWFGSTGELPSSSRSTPVRDFDCGLSCSRRFSRSGSGGAAAISRQSSGLSAKGSVVSANFPSSSGGTDARKKLSFDQSTERDSTRSSKQLRRRSGYTELSQGDPDNGGGEIITAPFAGQIHPTPVPSHIRIKKRWSRREDKKLSRKGVLVWPIKVKKLKERYSQKGLSLESEDFYDVCKRKFKATLHPFGLGPDSGSFITLSIQCMDDIKSTQKVPSTDIIVSVIDPQSPETHFQPICRQLERRGIRVIQQFISHTQVDRFLSDVIVVTIALTGKLADPDTDDSDINENVKSTV